jgi:hypothetical protein
MTNHTQQYHLTEEADQKRLAELSDRDAESVSDVSGELGLARFLAERCATTNPGLCNALLSTIAKLSIAAERHAVATSELLARPALRAFVQEMVAAVCDELQQLPDSKLHIENICRRIDAALVAAKNEPEQTPKLLAYEGNRPCD